uniref:Large ribosomal subunit protein uL24m n=1 Tax=Clastoptera arizonana TaxID=38151 RepID=A0A1B6C5X9_9HEMI
MRFTQALFLRFKDIGELTKIYANLPDSFIKRSMEMVEYKTPRGFPQYLPRTLKKKEYYFGKHRPWTSEFKVENQERKRKVYVEPTRDWSYFRGDVVEILSGKDKGKQGTIVQVIQERNWVIVEGLNCKLFKKEIG